MDLIATPKNPIPLGVSVGYLKGKGGVRLRYARWPSALKQRHGTVCIFTGRAEFIENISRWWESSGGEASPSRCSIGAAKADPAGW